MDRFTQPQTQFYENYCKQLFRVFNASEKYGIKLPGITFAQEAFRELITEVAKHTLEAVNNNGKIAYPVAKVSKTALTILTEAGFEFSSLKQQAVNAYRSTQFERAEELFEQCLKESNDPSEDISLKYNLASACRETKKIEKSIRLFYEVTVAYHQIYQKNQIKDGSTLCKYLSRYFDLLNAHSSYCSIFQAETKTLYDIYQLAELKDEALLSTMQTVMSCTKDNTYC